MERIIALAFLFFFLGGVALAQEAPKKDNGYCGLLNTKLSDGSYLIAGRKLTGFAWQEEVLARVSKLVPYNVEDEAKKRGAHYAKALLPFTSHVVVDGRLVTGQNPQSAAATAEAVTALLSKA